MGYEHPRTIQRVLDRSVWDADKIRDGLQEYALEELHDPASMLVVVESDSLLDGLGPDVDEQRQPRWARRLEAPDGRDPGLVVTSGNCDHDT